MIGVMWKNSAYRRTMLDNTQPETLKLHQVCFMLVALLSSSRYQDAFASLAPA